MTKILALVSLFALLNVRFLYAQTPTPPPIRPSQCSTKADTATTITFVNNAVQPVSVYWVDYQCNLQFYQTVAPGASYAQGTFTSHVWLVVDTVTTHVLLKAVGAATPQTVYVPDVRLSRTSDCSTHGDTPTRISFVNRGTETALIYWVDYECDLQFVLSLEPGTSTKWDTFVSHPWIIIGATTQQILGRAVGIADRQTIELPRTSLDRTTTDRPDDSPNYQVQVFYVLPSDGVDQQLDTNDTLIKTVNAWNEWLAQQTNGIRLRLDTYGGQLDIAFVRLSSTDAQLASQGLYIRDAIERELSQLGFKNPKKLYAVYYGGTANETCGGAPLPPDLVGRVDALYLNGQFADPNIPDCNQNPFGAVGSPGYLEFSMLHEIFHSLGAVPQCAPHYTQNGHTSDTPRDLMYAGNQPWQPQVLDEGHDDYYGHNNPNCLDVANSAFLDPLPANPALPPKWATLQ